jgi:hypothetical protein
MCSFGEFASSVAVVAGSKVSEVRLGALQHGEHTYPQLAVQQDQHPHHPKAAQMQMVRQLLKHFSVPPSLIVHRSSSI